MNILKELPNRILNYIENEDLEFDNIGCSDSQVIMFKDKVLKIEKSREESDVEHKMVKWLQNRLPVPTIYESFSYNGYNYLLMSKVEGEMLCSDSILSDVDKLIKLLVKGLKMLWSVSIDGCPSYNDINNKLSLAKIRVDNNLIDMDNVEEDTFGKNGFTSPKDLYKYLVENKPKEELVFSHGDYCLPNIFSKNNEISGFIDLGRSGVSDKWQDIALCVRSLEHNLGSNIYKAKFFKELGIPCNEEKLKYYILLDELF